MVKKYEILERKKIKEPYSNLFNRISITEAIQRDER